MPGTADEYRVYTSCNGRPDDNQKGYLRLEVWPSGGWMLFWGCPIEEIEDELESAINEVLRQLKRHKERRAERLQK